MAKEKEIKTNAMRIIEQLKISYQMHTYECDEFIEGTKVADLLGQDYSSVFKTLVAVGKSNLYFVFVIPVDCELDLKKAARSVGEKSIAMLPLKDLTKITGYIRGGCTAIGMKKQFETVVDICCEQKDTIMVSGGRPGCQIELLVADYLKACKGKLNDIKA